MDFNRQQIEAVIKKAQSIANVEYQSGYYACAPYTKEEIRRLLLTALYGGKMVCNCGSEEPNDMCGAGSPYCG